ncbi:MULTISPECIES: response regulator transcription factor [Paenibacillus]|jgi:DNA-binding response OmpR family regulator|uniref:response regulator transcription factor n=1 Tax=Paenibacillus TaxID=44249 RepID=UPI001C1235B1|nr:MULTISPECIES: response regulator transcription factor [Paenibacillus]MBU5354992.1 response regulator transcription factor [Paenibacillus barcinonensis]MDM5280180.1 response regulator transcription factor [Paenibacillus silvae]
MKNKLLYIEDDTEIATWVREDLEDRGYEVMWLGSGEGAVEAATGCSLVILDVMLPGLDGFTIGQRLKKEYPAVPIVMLSARTSIDDKLHGLDFADDYVTKPFHPDELAARIEVQLRKAGAAVSSNNVLKLDHLAIYEKDNRIVNEQTGEEIILSGKQFHIFSYLLRNMGMIRTKEQIYEAVWNEPYLDGDKTLMVHIRHLREKLELDPANPVIIQTVRGVGYRVKKP